MSEKYLYIIPLLILIALTLIYVGKREKNPDQLLPSIETTSHNSNNHAVLIYLKLSDAFGSPEGLEEIYALEEKMEEAVLQANAGEFDGDEFGEGEGVLFFYGNDADTLFKTIEPTLKQSRFISGARIIKRYGPADDEDSKEIVIEY
ncbi:MAG TPA: hypothetical protein PKC47_16390 [Petrimonas sp.]|nr:hypothetical protein [Petrimonas sp.]